MSNEEKLLSMIKYKDELIDSQNEIINIQIETIDKYEKFNEFLMSANSGAELGETKVLTLTKSINPKYQTEINVPYADYEYFYRITTWQKNPFYWLMRGTPIVDTDFQYFEKLGYKIEIERDKEKE